MGADIHMVAERLESDGIWHCITQFVDEDDYYHPKDEPYHDRNYDLFAILANVRNGRGFAGVETSRGFNIIAEPRGIPDDASPEYKRWTDAWDGDGHSHSYFTVAELMAFDWTQTTIKVGIVDVKEFVRFKLFGSPEAWSGGIWGREVKHVAPDEMERLIGTKHKVLSEALHTPDPSLKDLYTQINWPTVYSDSCSGFLGETLPKLWRLGPADKVRICFFFDN